MGIFKKISKDLRLDSERKRLIDRVNKHIDDERQKLISEYITYKDGEYSYAHTFESIDDVFEQAHNFAYNKLVSDYIMGNDNLSIGLLEEFAPFVNWDDVSRNKKLSEEFIETFEHMVNWNLVFIHQKLSKEFRKKHEHRISITRREEQDQQFIQGLEFGEIQLGGNFHHEVNLYNGSGLMNTNDVVVFNNNTITDNVNLIGYNTSISTNDVVTTNLATHTHDNEPLQEAYNNSEGQVLTVGNGITYAADYATATDSIAIGANATTTYVDASNTMSINGDATIDGDLTVTGTISGGGSSSDELIDKIDNLIEKVECIKGSFDDCSAFERFYGESEEKKEED